MLPSSLRKWSVFFFYGTVILYASTVASGMLPATELMTRNACVFFEESAPDGFSLVHPLCL